MVKCRKNLTPQCDTTLCLFAFIGHQTAGVMSVYLFMKRYTAEEMYRPHQGFYRPRLSNCSDYSGQFLHPDAWAGRGRSPSSISSEASLQMNSSGYPALLKCPEYEQMSSSPCWDRGCVVLVGVILIWLDFGINQSNDLILSSLNKSLVQRSWLFLIILNLPVCFIYTSRFCGEQNLMWRLASSCYPQLSHVVSGRTVKRWDRQGFDQVVLFI